MNRSGTRDSLDRWYTSPSVATACVARLIRLLGPRVFASIRFVDAGCGDGVFARALLAAGASPGRILCVDADPGVEALVADLVALGARFALGDFTAVPASEIRGAVVLGNPPFELAEAFIAHSRRCEAAWTALLLPASFRWSVLRSDRGVFADLLLIDGILPRAVFGGPARMAKKRAAAAKNEAFADAPAGDSALFVWARGAGRHPEIGEIRHEPTPGWPWDVEVEPARRAQGVLFAAGAP